MPDRSEHGGGPIQIGLLDPDRLRQKPLFAKLHALDEPLALTSELDELRAPVIGVRTERDQVLVEKRVDECLHVLPRHAAAACDPRHGRGAVPGDELQDSAHTECDRIFAVEALGFPGHGVPEEACFVEETIDGCHIDKYIVRLPMQLSI